MKKIFLILFLLISKKSLCQSISGFISDSAGEKIPLTNVYLKNTKIGISSDNTGFYELKNIPKGNYTLIVSLVGYQLKSIKINIKNDENITQNFILNETDSLEEIVFLIGNKKDESFELKLDKKGMLFSKSSYFSTCAFKIS